MEETNTVVFWDGGGEEILTIIGGPGVDSAMILEIFDTDFNRARMLALTGRCVDNTSEESLEEI